MTMSIELQIAILGVLVAVVIGAWQISLARKQVQVAREDSSRRVDPPSARAEPLLHSENLLHRLWSSCDPELQDALSLAYNQAKQEGKTRISTRTFFAAVARLRPGRLPEILDRFPEHSLPEPIGENVPREGRILEEEPLLSTCVENALLHLSEGTGPEHKLSTAEVFLDVAKHGTGASVARLREHGMTPEKIDQLARESGWEVRER
jgi:hypothetical protein